ncbi:MAG: hypothetical protein QM765_28255 [Myxococcales bacterium]
MSSYNKLTGQFTFNAIASLEGPSSAQYEFAVGVVIVLYYNSHTFLKAPSPLGVVGEGDNASPPANRATISNPFGTISPASFQGFMIRGFEITSDPAITVTEQIIDVSNPQLVGTTQAYVDWSCGLKSSATASITCVLNLVGVSHASSIVSSPGTQLRTLGPSASGASQSVTLDSGVVNWYAALQKSRAWVNGSVPGNLVEIAGGGVRQGGNSYIWDAVVDGDQLTTYRREVVMREVQLK